MLDEKDLEVYDLIAKSLINEMLERNPGLHRKLISKNSDELIQEIVEKEAPKVNRLFQVYLKNKAKTMQMILDGELEIIKHDWKIISQSLLEETEQGEIYQLSCSDGKTREVRYHPTLREPVTGNALGKILWEY
jgi:hypothetical protein